MMIDMNHHSEEYRVFVYAGKIPILDDCWNGDKVVNLSVNERDRIESIARKTKSNFGQLVENIEHLG